MRIWIVLLAWMVISCNEIEDCKISSSQDYAVVRFVWADSIPKTIREVAFTGIFEEDSMFYIRSMQDTLDDDTLTALVLPLNPADTEVSYYFFTDSVEYILNLSYSKKIEIFYQDCPPTFNYELDTAYSPNFDSVVVVGKPIESQIPVNVEIYL